MKSALEGKFGKIYTSYYVIDEAITTALVRTRRHDLAVDLGEYIIKSPRISQLSVTKKGFRRGLGDVHEA